jgi:lipoate-protein ligase A
MSKGLFAELDIYRDSAWRSAALNMAIDEALLERTKIPSIRFYRWKSPALSFGYFGNFADVAEHRTKRDLVRRWTGGGIVLHGDDLTYSIVIPATDPAFSESAMSIYENVHRALCNALVSTGQRAYVAGGVDPGAGVSDAGYSRHLCFTNPVRADVMVNGQKVAGAAQRRTRGGLLQQGSVQYVDLGNGLAERFARELSQACVEGKISSELLDRAEKIAGKKYATEAWLRRR